jgi:cellulose synthase/poly-beta-1,6-N-acetylglucosamine synthase-like glycosyltransferase
MLVAIFWAASAGLAWTYLGYPALLFVLSRVRPIVLRASADPPSVSVAIAVHDEEATIAARIEDALAQDQDGYSLTEVLIGSDGSDDATERVVRSLAARDARVRLLARRRAGQTVTQHALFEAATGQVVVLTDAETRFGPGCLSALVAPLRDERVDCTTGRLEWRDADATATASNEGRYWRYERAIRELESAAGLLTAVTGALLAVRRSAYRPVPPTASMDHLLPLYVRERGHLVVYVRGAWATDRPISGIREQFRNRSRTATRGIAANLSMARRLAPWSHPGAALAIWSHKLLRWATPWLTAIAVLAAIGLVAGGAPVYAAVPIAASIGVALALAGQLIAARGRRPPAVLAFARAFAVVNVAFAVGWLNVARGRRLATWHRTVWTVDN